MNELQELEIQEAEEFLEQEEMERFKITNLDQVNWALRKLAAYKAKAGEINALAEAEMERIKSWQERELKKLEDSRKFFEGLLEEYHRGRIAQNPKEKTITTPYGKLQIRRVPQKWNYDDSKLLDWLKKNRPELVRVKEEPNKQELKKIVQVSGLRVVDPDTGEVVEGVALEPETERFIVEVE